MLALPNSLKPEYEYNLIRLGSKFDGGYIVERASVINSNFLYSFGISTNWDFESDYLNFKNIELIAYDGSINNKFWNDQIIAKLKRLSFYKIAKIIYKRNKFYKFFNEKNFISKNIGKNLENSITFDEVISNNTNNDIFFKIDIEGSEYDILSSILENQKKIIGLAIEFHDCNKNLNKILDFVELFKLKIVHIHANNYLPPNENEIPNVLEITFARNPIPLREFISLPHKLDMPNRSKSPDIKLKFKN